MLRYSRADYTAEYEIKIFAPPDKVWDWLSRVDMWESWRQDVSSAYWVNSPGPDATLKWRVRKVFGFTARVDVWRKERELRWDAACYGTKVQHHLEIDGDYRSTVVKLRIAGNGGLLKFFATRVPFTHYLNRSNEIWLGALKTKLEAGKNDSILPPPGIDNPFANNVKLPSQRTGFDN